VIACSSALLLSSFVPLGVGKGAPPPVVAMNAVAKAPLSVVAPLTGRTVNALVALVAQLRQAGVAVSGADATIASVAVGGEAQGKAMTVLFAGGRSD
jgi:hypothetical protein